ncbi:MAG TPA: lipase family protein [Rudaea sp.]
MIDYDATRDALYRPALRPTVFAVGATVSPDAACAECSRLAYLHFESDAVQRQQLIDALARAGLTQWAGFADAKSGTEAFAVVREGSGEILVAFRGTEPGDITDLGTDINVRPTPWPIGGNVHSGFASAFDSVRADIERWVGQHGGNGALTVTGHSLGAALATLALSRWRARRLVTFGCPRVGDKAFVATLDLAASVRYVDCCDIVCTVPPASAWYADSGPKRYIDRFGSVRDTISEADVTADRENARVEYFLKYTGGRNNVVVRDLADHAPINYVRALV